MTKRTLAFIALLAALTAVLSAEVFYPWKSTFIGALDASGWPGLVIAPTKEAAFAFVLRVEREGEAAEGADLYYLVAEVGAHSPDGLYARMRFDLGLPFKMGRATPILMKPSPRRQALTLEWSRRDERTVIGRIIPPEDVRVTIVHYLPWGLKGELASLPDGQVRGQAAGAEGPAYRMWTSRPGEPAAAPAGGAARAYPPAGDRVIAFAACVDDSDRLAADHLARFRNAETIGTLVDEEAQAYEGKRVQARGLFAGLPEAITNSLHWTVLYQPGLHRLYAPAGRTWIFPRADGGPDDWTVFSGNGFLSALELALESQKLAVDALKAVLETQYPNGNIPSWRGRAGGSADRSQPPIGSYVVLKLFERLGDLEMLRYAYPCLQRWHAFWTAPRTDGTPRRDGNNDGLLEWGSDQALVGKSVAPWERNASGRMRAGWESGQDDLPSWDDAAFDEKSGTMALNCVDLNSLYALDAWCLAEIAGVLDLAADVERYRKEYERTKALVNATLWNDDLGFYCDRHWDGRLSVHKAASSFYPLLARIPDGARAQRMLKRLLDPKQFWGDFVVPSISRDDPAFRPGSQQSWRGAVRPVTNYLVYQGLKAYGFDAVAHELARKSAAMFLTSWKSFGLAPEDFDSLTGEAGGDRYQSAGPLAGLLALEEYLDFTPHEGFRFGILQPDAKGRLSRVLVQGRHYEVELSNSATVLREEGETLLEVDGSAVVRRFLYSEAEVSFNIKSLKPREVRLRFLKKGKYQLLVDGREVDVFSASSRRFDVPEGDHAVLVQLLEDLGKRSDDGPTR
ncbi:MAG TPA: trehalase family glycosidase [Candidatus Aminicenantes bacterium]|nr:trehalase family glycosidase [Candidatus Aminicenantes bacterium]HRY65201.1 trehalase family glycosidase [Candidatus Aminicenantes bacterium]HRZ72331.1 trehalase family glycosidase [Candidatus Aminicenantes bacterium]